MNAGRPVGVRVETGCLEGLDVRDPINDASADLQRARPPALPAPLFERAWRNQPSLRQVLLVKVLHNPVFSFAMRAEALWCAMFRDRTWTFWRVWSVDGPLERRDVYSLSDL